MKKYIILFAMILLTLTQQAYAYNSLAVDSYNRGLDYSKYGNYPEAIDSFTKAITLDPTFTDAYYNLGSLYEYTNDLANATNIFEQLIAKNPKDEETALKLANLYFKQKDYTKALADIALIPSTSTANYAKAQALSKKIDLILNPPPTEPSKTVYTKFEGPTGITKDSLGNMYVADFSSNTIYKVKAGTTVKTVFVQGVPLNGPIGLACDKKNNIYVANYGSGVISKITPDCKISTFLSAIKKPYYLYTDAYGFLYISEQGSGNVIKIKI